MYVALPIAVGLWDWVVIGNEHIRLVTGQTKILLW